MKSWPREWDVRSLFVYKNAATYIRHAQRESDGAVRRNELEDCIHDFSRGYSDGKERTHE